MEKGFIPNDYKIGKKKFTRPEGTFDIYGKDAVNRRYVEEKIRGICSRYGITEVVTPMFEKAELFRRGVGETTDVVMKEMYTFTRGDETFALRPEGTANAARAYLQTGAYAEAQPVKWFYIGPLFRAERPQKGRYRQFYTFGVEYYGTYSPYADAENIAVFYDVLQEFKIQNVVLKVNSLGGAACRAKYKDILKEYIDRHRADLCDKCLERYERNPLRVLDCKNERCAELMKDAPASYENLGAECAEHFGKMLNVLDAMSIPYEKDKKMVRGLDYYTRTVFEFICGDLGAQDAVGGGGRYDGLIAEVGGNDTGAVGFGMGFDRLMLILEEQKLLPDIDVKPSLFIGSADDEGLIKSVEIACALRKRGFWVETELTGRSVKAQMKYANKIGAGYAMVIGADEIKAGSVKLKNMNDGNECIVKLNKIDEIEKEIRYNG